MTLQEHEDRILKKYRAMGERVISDGAISVGYEKVPRRLLVVLKEANDPHGASEWDLRSYGRWGGRPATWNNLARWSALFTDPSLSFGDIDVSDRGKRAQHLARIAVTNLKKVPGGGRSDLKTIEVYALRHKELLDEQLQLYKPHLTLAAGTFEILVRLRDKEKSVIPKQGDCFPHFADNDLGLCIDFYHPQQRRFTNRCLFEFLTQQLRCHGFAS